MTRTALAVSPHLDDAAFSCGGTLARLAQAGWRVVVVTPFTRSVPAPQGFALACQRDKGLGPEVDYMALRRGEDRLAMAALGAVPVHLSFAEAPHRGYDSATALFGPVRPDDDIGTVLAAALGDVMASHAPDLVLAPQGIGAHVDHVQVVMALRRVLAPSVPVLWWRDFPYVARAADPPMPFRAVFEALPQREAVLAAADLAAREAACLAYASQLGFQFGGAAGLKAKLARRGATELFRGVAPLPD